MSILCVHKAAEAVILVLGYAEVKVEDLIKMLQLADNEMYVSFENHIFHQLKCIAMGTACSPNVRNFYARVQKINISFDHKEWQSGPNPNILL